VNPEQKVDIESVIGCAGGQRFSRRHRSSNLFMNILYPLQCGTSQRPIVENNRPHSAHRALQASERVRLKATVVGDPGGDFRMRQLHEQRATSRKQQNHLAIHTPNRHVGREKPAVLGRVILVQHQDKGNSIRGSIQPLDADESMLRQVPDGILYNGSLAL